MALPSILRGKTLHSVRHSATHPSISLSFTDGTSYEIRAQNYSPSSSSPTVWSLLQTPAPDATIEQAFAPSNGTTIDVSLEVLDCTYITMSDKASRIEPTQGEIKWDQSHVALAFKFQPRPPSDAMVLDSIPENKPRWHCFWVTREEYSEAKSFTGFQDCVHRSYDDVYLQPKEGKPGSASTSSQKSPVRASWGRRKGSKWRPSEDTYASEFPSGSEHRDLTTTTRSNRSRTRSRSPIKPDSTGTPTRSHTFPQPWSTNPSPTKPIPMARRGSHADVAANPQSSSWIDRSSPSRNRSLWQDNFSSRPGSPSKLDISWTPKRDHRAPYTNMGSRSASPTKSWNSSHHWPESPTKMRTRAQPAPPFLSVSSQGNPAYHPSSSPTRDSIFSNGSSSSDISTPSLTNSTSSEASNGGWLIVENGSVRTTAIEG
jgi:hypothetical protein